MMFAGMCRALGLPNLTELFRYGYIGSTQAYAAIFSILFGDTACKIEKLNLFNKTDRVQWKEIRRTNSDEVLKITSQLLVECIKVRH